MRFKIVVEYDGTRYCGWQIQPSGETIQSVLESALQRLEGAPVRVGASGRTDAGVHASGQVASFVLHRPITAEALLAALNALTPPDLSVRCVEVVADDFDPRRAASSRAYVYRIWNARIPSPFWRHYAWHVRFGLDLEAMQAASARLVGEHDFSAFRAAGCDAEHPVRRVLVSRLEKEGSLLHYHIEATAFLRHMVRNIVGTLVEVGSGKRSAAEIPALLTSRKRALAGPTAPAHGLCLTTVRYEARKGSGPANVQAPEPTQRAGLRTHKPDPAQDPSRRRDR